MSDIFDLSKYKKLNRIGHGGFGDVYKIADKNTNDFFAAKILRNTLIDDPNSILELRREINILYRLHHPSVVKFIGYSPVDFSKQFHPVLVTEYCKNGSLRGIFNQQRQLRSRPILDDTQKLINIYGIASAMSFLHSHNILHRDLKPENILEDDYLFPKITDFGLSKILHENADSMTTQSLSHRLGTPMYMAPELFDFECESSKQMDVYAFSFIMYEILTSKQPFEDVKFNHRDPMQVFNVVVIRQMRPNIPETIPNCYKKLIEKCWSHNPNDRPSFSKIVEELETNKEFITNSINKDKYYNYINYIKSQGQSFDKNKKFDKILLTDYQEEPKQQEKEKEKDQDDDKNVDDNFGSNVALWKNWGKIVFITSELYPFSHFSDNAIMVWELAKQLSKMGIDIHCISPYYNEDKNGQTDYLKKYGIIFNSSLEYYTQEKGAISFGIHHGVVEGVNCWFIHSFDYFGSPFPTNGSIDFKIEFLTIFAKISLMFMFKFDLRSHFIVTFDWQTGFFPLIAKRVFNYFGSCSFLHVAPSLETKYNGKIYLDDKDINSCKIDQDILKYKSIFYDHVDNSIDPSRCALSLCNQFATVSKRYLSDLLESSNYLYLLKDFPKPFACSTGIDINNQKSILKKIGLNQKESKRMIQKKFFNSCIDDYKCLFVFVGPICEQRGVHLIADCFEELNRNYNGQLQFLVLGKADQNDDLYGIPCSQKMDDLNKKYPNNFNVSSSSENDEELAIMAANFVLMPSLFEPSGFIQQKAFVSGSPVIAFKTGGLSDTVFEFDMKKKTGNGLLFWCHKQKDFMMAIDRAYALFIDKKNYNILRENASKSALPIEKTADMWLDGFTRMFFSL